MTTCFLCPLINFIAQFYVNKVKGLTGGITDNREETQRNAEKYT